MAAAPEVMTIVSACVPPLAAAEYVLTVEQRVDPERFEKEQRFWVTAPRFALGPSDLYGVYPPPNADGDFALTLPQIVLSRRTLPWERRLRGGDETRDLPWLALLLLDEDEARAVTVVSRTLAEALRPKEAGVAGPADLTPAPWERADEDLCRTLDLPVELFRAVAPSWRDLRYLAHARRLGASHAADMEAESGDGAEWFAVVLGNRLPTPGRRHTVHVVSLEGMEEQLPDHPKPAAATQGALRFVVLTSWQFQDVAGAGFYELTEKLAAQAGPFRLRRPELPAGSPTAFVEAALASGYAPVAHTTRHGAKTVSWYRGPLVPAFLPTDPQNAVYSSADEALRYDPATGFFDVSYAAAWQLGRLLGLENHHFARALDRFTLERVRRAADALARATAQRRFGRDTGDMTGVVIDLLRRNSPQALDRAAAAPRGEASDRAEGDRHARLKAQLESDMKGEDAAAIPDEIRRWLGRLFLLHGVPLPYLVPDGRLLEPESLRVFYLDTGWVGALLDGALSLGRSPEARLFLDKAMAGNFLGAVLDDSGVDREKTFDDLQVPPPSPEERARPIVGHVTGFLLRSELVSGWRGWKIVGRDAAGRPLRALRRDRLAGDVLLCIFSGHLRELVITQGPHGLHLGVTRTGPDRYVKILDGAPGEVSVPMRDARRVLRVDELCRALAGTRAADVNAAAFARSMMVRPIELTLRLDVIPTRPQAIEPR
jgi:hypothetical protein